jgi:DNA uptake protein ComE-like DNA-binding protein
LLKQIKSYLEISNFERRGLFALLFVFTLVASYYYLVSYYGEAAPQVDHQKIANFQAQIDKSISDSKSFDKVYSEGKYVREQVNFLPFNPNTDGFKELLKKGVPYDAVKNIVNYRKKGGVYNKKDDLKKLYGIDEELYAKLAPYIQLPDSFVYEGKQEWKGNNDYESVPKEVVQVDINTSTPEELQTVSGIGEFYAKTIIERRTELGGFYSNVQLDEVYGLSPETIATIIPQLVFDSTSVKLLAINTLEYEDLAKHPYLSYKEARAVVNYIDQHGGFTEAKQLEELHIFQGKNISRLLPYLDLN